MKAANKSPASSLSTDAWSRSARLRPFVRRACADWRGPWFIANRRLMDYLLVYIDQGTGRFSVNGRAFDVGPGDLIWFPPNALHEMRGHAPRMHVLYIHFDLLYDPVRSPRERITNAGQRDLGAETRFIHPPLRDVEIDRWRGKLPVINGAAIHALIWQLCVESLGGGDPFLSSGLLLQIIGEIARGLSRGATRVSARWQALQRAAEEILRNTGAGLDLPALARQAHLSISHFRRLFREIHKKSPREFYEVTRAQKACEMIHYSTSTLTAIARELGFSTVHNFSRAFKRQLGISPRAYRQRTISRSARILNS